MMPKVLSGGLFLLTITMLAGCQSKTEGDASKKAGIAKDDSPNKASGSKTSNLKDGSSTTSKEGDTQPDGAEATDDAVVKVDARTLLGEYTNDQGAADRKYKGKVLQVQGAVKYWGDLSGVGLDGGKDIPALVRCLFPPDGTKAIREHNQVAHRQKGKEIQASTTVVIQGKCNGISTGRIVLGLRAVTLNNCKVIDPVLLKR
jgi:hypothetical protein